MTERSQFFREGYEAASQGCAYSDDCPYTFARAQLPQAEFDRTMRPKMTEWFKGWQAWRKEHSAIIERTP